MRQRVLSVVSPVLLLVAVSTLAVHLLRAPQRVLLLLLDQPPLLLSHQVIRLPLLHLLLLQLHRAPLHPKALLDHQVLLHRTAPVDLHLTALVTHHLVVQVHRQVDLLLTVLRDHPAGLHLEVLLILQVLLLLVAHLKHRATLLLEVLLILLVIRLPVVLPSLPVVAHLLLQVTLLVETQVSRPVTHQVAPLVNHLVEVSIPVLHHLRAHL